MRGLQRSSGLRDDAEHTVRGQAPLAFNDRRQRLAGHELHHDVGRSLLFTIIKHVCDALVVDESCVPGFGAEALEEARVAHVLVFKDLDGDRATDDGVTGFPYFTHAAYGDT